MYTVCVYSKRTVFKDEEKCLKYNFTGWILVFYWDPLNYMEMGYHHFHECKFQGRLNSYSAIKGTYFSGFSCVHQIFNYLNLRLNATSSCL